ncbi:hypothetical protein MKD38_06165 [Cupriavidus sp. WGlv3]|uniref:hypothetical protein n=1 Tax=Cupriavidus sp. WGlv3 TaxID=2919924 RepID=UPI0020909D52|nr:hypothetical protein [Cupriavidus sp. WGlv3]MCO4861248.1 hypothetical protein [Cupriavidus sp. WGlv3]
MDKSTYGPCGPTQFDLGFAHGADADEAPSDLKFQSRVPAYQVGFIVGRSFCTAVKQGNHHAMVATAARLGSRYGVPPEDILDVLGLSQAHQEAFRKAYAKPNTY